MLLHIHTSQALTQAQPPFLRRIRSVLPPNFPLALPWYEKGLDFSCTGCGNCCRVDGDVWLAPEEVANIIQVVDDVSSIDEFRKNYVRGELTPADGDLSQSWMCLKRKEGSCIFLDAAGQCGIYEVRPVQCRTYPFWPSILEKSEYWKEEAVLPDDMDVDEMKEGERHWSAENGGCEGIYIGKVIDAVAAMKDLTDVDLEQLLEQQRKVGIVEREEINAKRRESKAHWKRFPGEEIKRNSWYL